jgi:hypothetical protein
MNLFKMYRPSGSEGNAGERGAITNTAVQNTVTSADAVSKVGEQVYEQRTNNKVRVSKGSGAIQTTKPTTIWKYKIGTEGDTIGSSVEYKNVPIGIKK